MAVVLTYDGHNAKGDAHKLEIIDSTDPAPFTNDEVIGLKGGLIITAQGDANDPFARYTTSSLEYTFRLTNADLLTFYDRLVGSPEGRYYLRYYIKGNIEFVGKILPDVGSVELDQPRPLLTMTAVDILADLKGREMTTAAADNASAIEHVITVLKQSSMYADAYEDDDIVLCTNASLSTAQMSGDTWAQIAIQEYIWRKRDSELSPFDYEDCDTLLIDWLNAMGSRIYCTRGRVVIESVIQRTLGDIGYYQYDRAALDVSPLVGFYQLPTTTNTLYRNIRSGGPANMRNIGGVPQHKHLAPARSIVLTKTGYGYVNLIRNQVMAVEAVGVQGPDTYTGIYGQEIKLTTVNDAGSKRLIMSLNIDCYIEAGASVDAIPEYNLEVSYKIQVGNYYLKNKDGITQLQYIPDSISMQPSPEWSTDSTNRFTYRPIGERIPTRGEIDTSIFESKRYHQVIIISEDLPATGDLLFTLTDIRLRSSVDGSVVTVPNEAHFYYTMLLNSRIGVGEDLEDVFDESSKTEVMRIVTSDNKDVYEVETRLIDYSDNANDPRTIVKPNTSPTVGLTPWTDSTLQLGGRLDDLLLSQAIAIVQNPVRVIDTVVSGVIRMSDVYEHKHRIDNSYYRCMPVSVTYDCDNVVSSITVMALRNDPIPVVTQVTNNNNVGIREALPTEVSLATNGLGGGGISSSPASIYPLYYSATLTGTTLDVAGITLPDPATINDATRRLLSVLVAGTEYYLVTAISTDPRDQRGQVTTDKTGGNNRLVFGRPLTGQRVTVRLYGFISSTPPPSQ